MEDSCPYVLKQKMNPMKISLLFLGFSFEETHSQRGGLIQCLSRLWTCSQSGSPDFNDFWISGNQIPPNTPYFMVELPETEQTTLSAARVLPDRLDCCKAQRCIPALVPAPCEQPTSPCSCPFRPVLSRDHLMCWGRKCWLVSLGWVKGDKGYITQELLLPR